LIESILASARKKNTALGLTGLLCHSGDIFLQVLEGGRTAVNTMYHTIARDPRHNELCLLHYEQISERRFSSWAMGHLNLSKSNIALLLKYGEKPQLDPYTVSGRASLSMLEELIASAQSGNGREN
jgi:hypothetical protein